jgi:hypothetical protein
MARPREKGLQRFEGVEIRVARSDPQDYLITSEHEDGDTVYSVGSEGRIMLQENDAESLAVCVFRAPSGCPDVAIHIKR